MHKIHAKPFSLSDFSIDNLEEESKDILLEMLDTMNYYRERYLVTKDKRYWWQLIQLLPSSYNQTRNVMLNYEALANIYKSRKNHKLDEWKVFCMWIEELPYSELITGPCLDDIPISKDIMNEAERRVEENKNV